MSLPTGVVSFLLTDVEGSTARWDAAPSLTATVMERHDHAINAIVRAHHGYLLKHKGEGDSTLSVFHRATDAVAAAIAIVRAMDPGTWADAPAVRIALHTGEAHERDGDYFGPTLNRAARVRGLAGGNQILVTTATAQLVVDHLPGQSALVDRGVRELRGITRAGRVFELLPGTPDDDAAPHLAGDAPDPDAPSVATALRPAPLFVGRARELEELRAVWERAKAGDQRLALIAGEPGIGKTELAAQLATAVAGEALVWFGRCEEDLSAPYQPFIEGMGPWLAALTAPEAAELPATALAEATRLWPDLAARFPALPPPVSGEPGFERHACFQAIVALLAHASRDQPILFIVDDVHWATAPTMLLLRHLERAEAQLRVLMVGTYRDTDIDGEHPLASARADWRRTASVCVVNLGGLDTADVRALVLNRGGDAHTVDAATLAQHLHDETAGNPFFIGEVLANRREDGDLDVPDSVRDVIERRLARLPAVSQHALTYAAVLGREFDYDDLAAAIEESERGDVLDAVEAAVGAGLLVERADDFSFAHALVRHAVLDRLSTRRRARIHLDVARAIEARPGGRERVETLAFHFAAAPGREADAARYGYAAGLRALDRLAFDQALTTFEHARGLLDSSGSDEPELAVDLDLALAHAQRGTTSGAGRDVCLRAVVGAIALGDPDRAGAAAMFLSEVNGIAWTDGEVIHAIERANELPDASPSARALLRSALSIVREQQGDDEAAARASTEALDAAKLSGDDEALYHAIWSRIGVVLGTPLVEERQQLIVDMRAVGKRTRSVTIANEAELADAVVRFELGDRRRFTAAISQLAELYEQAGRWTGHMLGWSPAWPAAFLALLDGRWDDATRFSDAMLSAAGEQPHPDCVAAYAAQVFQRGRELGEHATLLPLVEDAIRGDPELVIYQAALTSMLAEMGDLARAGDLLGALAGPGLPAVRRDQERPATLALLAETAATLGDAERSRWLLDELQPYAGRMLIVQSAVVAVGAADRFIGMLAATVGDGELATRSFEQARALESAMDATAHVARTELWQARALRRRGLETEAAAVAADGLTIATELRMTLLADQLLAIAGAPA